MSIKDRSLKVLSVLTLLTIAACNVVAAERPVIIPAPLVGNSKTVDSIQTAVLSGGCFWGVQGIYQHVRGVKKVLSGYAGGEASTATYEQVSDGNTGHAESVQIVFDPQQISYGEILQIYFSVVHDPTQLNRQGPDVGTQYRSSIFYVDEAQKNIAQQYIAQLNKSNVYGRTIVTRTDPLKAFYAAESYHQNYLINNPHNPYIVINDLPKIRYLKQLFPTYYIEQAVTVASETARH